jgi:hypothetical protein
MIPIQLKPAETETGRRSGGRIFWPFPCPGVFSQVVKIGNEQFAEHLHGIRDHAPFARRSGSRAQNQQQGDPGHEDDLQVEGHGMAEKRYDQLMNSSEFSHVSEPLVQSLTEVKINRDPCSIRITS